MNFSRHVPAATLLCGALSWAQPELAWDEFRPRLAVDAGHIVNGEYNGKELALQPLNRNMVVLEQGATHGAWRFDAGFKAIIWWPFQELPTEPHHRNIRVEPRVSRIQARRGLGGNAFVEFGFFPYKYNPDARNLGEYLYRSGTYPGIVRTTDGLHLMDHALFEAYGLHARSSLLGGRLVQDFNLFSEPTSVPVGDLTPAYEVSVNLPLLQFGAGAAWNRLISYDSRQVRPRERDNAYYEVDSVNGNGVEFSGPIGLLPLSSPVRARILAGDSSVRVLHYYTQRGIKLMARAALDLGGLIPAEHRNPGDLRVFAEAALLGLENQVFYYENRLQRVPIMFGLNVPTWRLLDLLTVQGEYYAARFANSREFNYFAYPIWTITPAYDPGDYRRDDWKWSVYGRRAVNRLLTVHAQVANDHLRQLEFNTNPSATPLTQTPENWYYLLRLECRL